MHHRCVRFCGVKYVGFEIDSSSLLFHLMRVGRLLFEVASLEIFVFFFCFYERVSFEIASFQK